ncbi:unnamed protein product [Sphagnum jensenii]|uniref:Uncharacterized protein n=1 Tax=Sphagnum jensenii TaxID=128206 RepID=A0ABP0XB77_9BRYO
MHCYCCTRSRNYVQQEYHQFVMRMLLPPPPPFLSSNGKNRTGSSQIFIATGLSVPPPPSQRSCDTTEHQIISY